MSRLQLLNYCRQLLASMLNYISGFMETIVLPSSNKGRREHISRVGKKPEAEHLLHADDEKHIISIMIFGIKLSLSIIWMVIRVLDPYRTHVRQCNGKLHQLVFSV